MLIRVPTESILPGMYVAELDRPWIETPFLFQGFVIREPEEIQWMTANCSYVFVDDLQSEDRPELRSRLIGLVGQKSRSRVTVEFEEWSGKDRLLATLQRADGTRREAAINYRDVIAHHVGDLASERSIGDAREIASSLKESIEDNPLTAKWLAVIREKEDDIATHCVNTSMIAVGFARHLGLNAAQQAAISRGALLHDMALARLPAWLIAKAKNQQALSAQERRLFELHPSFLQKHMQVRNADDHAVMDIVSGHHQRADGKGYPGGFRATDLDVLVKLVSVVDRYEELTSGLLSEKRLPPSVALTTLTAESRDGLDAELVSEFIRYQGIYPLGSVVQFKRGSKGVIINSNEGNRLKPVVLIVQDEDGRPLLPRRVMDMSTLSDEVAERYVIDKVLDPELERINVREIMISELSISA